MWRLWFGSGFGSRGHAVLSNPCLCLGMAGGSSHLGLSGFNPAGIESRSQASSELGLGFSLLFSVSELKPKSQNLATKDLEPKSQPMDKDKTIQKFQCAGRQALQGGRECIKAPQHHG